MTGRELTWGGGILLLGIFLGAVFMRSKSTPPAAPAQPDAAPSSEPESPVADEPELQADARHARPEPAPAPSPTPPPPDAAEAGPPDAEAPFLAHISIRPAPAKHRCLDESHKHALQLFRCHGKDNDNQRWSFTAEADGTSHLVNDKGECVALEALGSPLLTKPCGADSLKVRRRADGRLLDLITERCLTARGIDNHTPVTLEPCDSSDMQQEWYLKE